MDEIEQRSDYWPEVVTVTVNNSQMAERPVIKSVVVENETIINGGEIHITVSGTADARVVQGFYSRSNPMGAWGCGFHEITTYVVSASSLLSYHEYPPFL